MTTRASEHHDDPTFSFDPFARHQFYTEVNRQLVERTMALLAPDQRPPGEPLQLVELASGTGAVTELILDAVARFEHPAQLVCVDPSLDALHLAEQRLRGQPVSFVQGDASALGRAVGQVDAAFFCNAIHLVADKEACVESLVEVLAPHGLLALNTTFYEGAYVAGSAPFYYALTKGSLGWLRQQHPEVRLAHRGKVTARQWLTPDEYVELVRRHGLETAWLQEDTVQFPLRAIQDIGRYALFIEGALPGIPLPLGAAALEASAAQAFNDLHLDAVPRKWL